MRQALARRTGTGTSVLGLAVTMTSRTATRPPSPARRTRCWPTMPRRAAASDSRTWRCWKGGNRSVQRLTVSAASVVWRVDRTRWPVSAAARAFLRVSASRISPTRMTSGSWRMAARMAMVKSLVSTRTSRWLTMPSLSAWRTSIGSSMAQHHPDRAALAEGVDPEPPDPGQGVGEVGLVGLLELLEQVGTDQLAKQALGHLGGEAGPVEHDQAPVHPHARRRPDLQVQVRPLGGDQRLQPGQHARHRLSPSPGRAPSAGTP